MKRFLPILLTLSIAAVAGCGGGGGDAGDADEGTGTSSKAAEGSSDASDTSAPSKTPGGDSDLSTSMQVYLNQLDVEDPNARMSALEEIRKAGEEARPIWAQLQTLAVEDPDVDVRTIVVHALMAVDRDAALETLATMLEDESDIVRLEVLNAFGQYPAGTVTPFLLKAADDDDVGIRSEAIRVIGSLGLETDEILAKLEAALEDMDGTVIRAAVQALGEIIATDSADKIATLCLRDRDEGVRQHSCRVLGELGETSNQVVFGLIGNLDDEALGVREAAFRSLVDLTNPDDTFGYSPSEIDEETRSAAIEKWKSFWESKSDN